MFGVSKLYGYLAAAVAVVLLAYFYIIKPHYDLIEAKETIKDVKHEAKRDIFETKYESIKPHIKPPRIKHEELNLSTGHHTITFGR